MKKVALIVAAVLVIGGMAWLVLGNGKDDNQTAQQPEQVSTEQQADTHEEEETKEFTLAQVAEHKTADDCWTVIDGRVYDVTDFVQQHPGGEEILRACGTDATTLFKTRTTEEGEAVGSGTPHSSSAEATLEQYEIGHLAQ